MITQYEVPAILREELHVMEDKMYPTNIAADVYKWVHYFTVYTRTAIQSHHIKTVKKCFKLAEQLYQYGDNVVKMCIENIFVYAFTSFIPKDRIERLILQSFIPASLNAVYLKQVSASGC